MKQTAPLNISPDLVIDKMHFQEPVTYRAPFAVLESFVNGEGQDRALLIEAPDGTSLEIQGRAQDTVVVYSRIAYTTGYIASEKGKLPVELDLKRRSLGGRALNFLTRKKPEGEVKISPSVRALD